MKLQNESLLRFDAYVNGEWISAEDGNRYTLTNPATGEAIGEVANLSSSQVRGAIDAAENSFAAWSKKTAKERAAILRRWYELIMANQEDLAQIMTLEQGKPLAETRGEVAYGASFIEWFAEEGKRIYGDVIPTHASDKRILVLKQPIGVVAAITPWNFPNAMITRKVGPALAAGCPCVVKPADNTPLSALALAVLGEEAGLPPGVLNILTTTDAPSVGTEFATNSKVRKLSFTGSTRVGKLLMEQSASTVKKLSLELGGNAPFIVFDDADVDAAVQGAIVSKYRNAGQTCVCANRLYVQSGIYDAFVEKYKVAVAAMTVGNGAEPDTVIGPMITEQAAQKVAGLVEDAVAKGAKVALGGGLHALGGSFFEPTILTDVTSDMRLVHEEIFGPVAPLIRFETEEEVIAAANDTNYGLAAYFYTRDLGRVWRVQEALEYGIVGVNEGIISTEVAPFGGVKESGLGREGSKYGIEDFIEIKYCLHGGLGL